MTEDQYLEITKDMDSNFKDEINTMKIYLNLVNAKILSKEKVINNIQFDIAMGKMGSYNSYSQNNQNNTITINKQNVLNDYSNNIIVYLFLNLLYREKV